jgi:hypothetical protein
MTVSESIALLQLLATIPIGLLAFQVSRDLGLRQGERDVRKAWLDFDVGVLAHPELRRTADKMLHDGHVFDDLNADEQELWRWICYAVRNPLENFHQALVRRHRGLLRRWWRGPVCSDDAYASLVSCVDQLVHHETFMEIAKRFSADPAFYDTCVSVRDRTRCDSSEGRPHTRESDRDPFLRKAHRCLAVYAATPQPVRPIVRATTPAGHGGA